MITRNKVSADLYLDQQPELQATLKAWLETLDLNGLHGVAFDSPDINEIECRSRDGFIRASHNFGGFDLVYMSDVSACVGSGCGPSLPEIERQEVQAYSEAIAWFKAGAYIGLEHLTDEQINYHYLYEIGRGDLAEQLSEVEREWMDTPVWWGVRAMYEGRDEEGTHTLMLYASGNVGEYHGAFGKGSTTLGEWTVRFRTASGLKRQLDRLTAKVTKVF